MSRKFLDDGVELRPNSLLGLPSQVNQYYESGHLFLDPISGKRFVNEGANDRNSSLFVNEQYNALILFDNMDLLPQLVGAAGAGVDPYLKVVGTNAASTDATFVAAGGGVQLATHGSSADTTILAVQTAGNSVWNAVSYDITNQIVFEASIVTDTTITGIRIHAGLKLTNTGTTTTDNDQTFLFYDDAVSANFQTVDSNNNVDNVLDSGVAVAASTAYLLQIKVGTDLKPRYYINGVLVQTGNALRTGQTLLPFVGVTANTAAVRKVQVRNVRIVIPRAPIV